MRMKENSREDPFSENSMERYHHPAERETFRFDQYRHGTVSADPVGKAILKAYSGLDRRTAWGTDADDSYRKEEMGKYHEMQALAHEKTLPLQMESCVQLTSPCFAVYLSKGTLIVEPGKLLVAAGYDIRAFNTTNFKKSMHCNPFTYIHSEKDILKLVTVLISNTKGEGKGGDDFWVKAETLLYIALIGYIHYELPLEKQNFTTLIDMLNKMDPEFPDHITMHLQVAPQQAMA